MRCHTRVEKKISFDKKKAQSKSKSTSTANESGRPAKKLYFRSDPTILRHKTYNPDLV